MMCKNEQLNQKLLLVSEFNKGFVYLIGLDFSFKLP